MIRLRIAVFCTGGTNLGFGHFFRSRVFVKYAPPEFKVKLFPIASHEDHHLFRDVNDIAKICDTEQEALREILAFMPEVCVFDTVYCSEDFFYSLKSEVRYLASISPVFNHMAEIDMLFTRNADTEPIANIKIFKGFEYAIFNENCYPISDAIYQNNLEKPFLTIGIAMGGGDAPNKTLTILKQISELKIPCSFWVLLGEGYKHSYQGLVDCIRKDRDHEIILAKTNRSIWSIFSNCALGILAGGLTTVEAIYAGLPTLNIFEKQEHLKATGKRIFDEAMAINIGLFTEISLSKLKQTIEYLNENREVLLQMRERTKGTIDRLGPNRIFHVLGKYLKTKAS